MWGLSVLLCHNVFNVIGFHVFIAVVVQMMVDFWNLKESVPIVFRLILGQRQTDGRTGRQASRAGPPHEAFLLLCKECTKIYIHCF
jgi:hypothetical protein